jgi:hypothetical protein
MDSLGKAVYACGAINASGVWGNGDTQEANPVLGFSWLPTGVGTRYQISLNGGHDLVWARNNTTGARDRKKSSNDYEFVVRVYTGRGGIPLLPFFGKKCGIVLCAFEVRLRSTYNEFKAHEVTSLVVAGPWFFILGSPGSSKRLALGFQPGFRVEKTDTTFSGTQFIGLASVDARGTVSHAVTGGLFFSYAPRLSGNPPGKSYRTSLSADLNIPINKWLTLVPAFEHRHDSQPPPGARTEDDYQAKLFFQVATPLGEKK